jgi:eukaryotic-like serine/threonine-protein kinase
MNKTQEEVSETTSDCAAGAAQTLDASARTPAELAPGLRLAGRYRIARLLGQGAAGTVYEAVDEQRSGLRVALKLLHAHQASALYRLKNEFRALAETVHPNLVGLHGLGVDALGWFVVMDLIDPSSDFLSYVRESRAESFDERRLRAALVQLVRGVAAIHTAGKLHRDLKPRNVLVTGEGRVVIVDFGLVGDLERGGVGVTQEGLFAGTPAYAAPEQMLGQGLGPKADLYALGVMLYEALTGELPASEGSPGELLAHKLRAAPPAPSTRRAGVPTDLDQLCTALLQLDPEQRPDPQQVLEQLGAHSAQPAEPASSLPFLARSDELGVLSAAASGASGAPSIVVVSGPSGIGKTALVGRFLERAGRGASTACMRGRCHPHEQLPFKAFDTLVDELGRLLVRAPALEAASLMPRDIRILSRIFPTLSRVPAVNMMPAGRDLELDQALLRGRAFAALKELLARIADRRPLVLAFDDLQWSDRDSAELLCELLREPGAPACLFVCVFREAQPGESPLAETLRALPGAIDLRLEPLDSRSSEDLARSLLGPAWPAAELELVVQESAGSPLLLKELSRHARGSGRVAELRETVAARILQLEPDARRLLELVCISGQPLELGVALRVAQVEPQALPSVLASGLLRTSVQHGRECLESHHDRIREAVVAGLTPLVRARLHGELAREFAQAPTPDPELIARHYLAADQPALAARYAMAAAEQARHALAFGRAAELYELALAHGAAADRPRLQAELADAYANVGRLADAAELYELAHEHASDGERRHELGGKAMVLYLLGGQIERGAHLARALCKQIGIRPPPRSRWLTALAMLPLYLRYWLGKRIASLPVPHESRHSATSRQRLELCVRAARGFAHWSFEHGAYFALQAVLIIRSRRDTKHWPIALACEVSARSLPPGVSSERDEREMATALALAERQGDEEVHALLLGGEGSRCVAVGHYARALELFERAEQLSARRGRSLAPISNWVRTGLYAAWIATGRMDLMLARTDAWLAEARAVGDLWGEQVTQLMGSYRFLALDQPQAMTDALRDLIGGAGDKGPPFPVLPAWHVEPVLYLDQPERALALYRSLQRAPVHAAEQRWGIGRVSHSQLMIRMYLAVAQREPSRRGACWRAVEREVHHLQREGFVVAPAVIAQARAGLAMQRGDADEALRELERAAQGYASAGAQLIAAAARERIGKLSPGEQGARQVAEARAQAGALGVRNPERMFRSLLTGFAD